MYHRKARTIQYRAKHVGIKLPHHFGIDQFRLAERYLETKAGKRNGLIDEALDPDLVPFGWTIIVRSIPEMIHYEVAGVSAIEMTQHIERRPGTISGRIVIGPVDNGGVLVQISPEQQIVSRRTIAEQLQQQIVDFRQFKISNGTA